MEKDRSKSSSRDKAARLEKGHGKGGLEKGHDKGGLEKGKQIRGGANRKPSLDMKEEELSQVFDLIMKRKEQGLLILGSTIPLMLLRQHLLRV